MWPNARARLFGELLALGIKRTDHVCMAVWKLEDRLPIFTELFGMKVAGRFQNPEAGYKGVTLDVPGGGALFQLYEGGWEDWYSPAQSSATMSEAIPRTT